MAALAPLAALAALLVLPPPATAGAGAPDQPYFAETTGGALDQDADANPIVGHFTDQVFDDILWYQAGSGREALWTPCPDCAEPFTKRQLSAANQVTGTYEPIVGDFSGDRLDDIYWVSSSAAADYLWTNSGAGTFTTRRFDAPTGELAPLVLPDSRSGTGKDDILWRASGDRLSRLWVFPDDGSGAARTKGWLRVPDGRPLVGDFDGNGAADVLWYPSVTTCRCEVPSAASATDHLWRRPSSQASSFGVTTLNIKGEYAPVVGRFSHDGDPRDDILWIGQYDLCCSAPTDRPDSLWEGRSSGGFTASKQSFPSAGGGFVMGHDTADTVIISDGADQSVWFDTTSGPVLRPVGTTFSGPFVPLVGRFVDADRADIFAYAPGPAAERLYHPIF